MTIARLLLRSAQLWGEKPALIDELRDRSISFSQMADAVFFRIEASAAWPCRWG